MSAHLWVNVGRSAHSHHVYFQIVLPDNEQAKRKLPNTGILLIVNIRLHESSCNSFLMCHKTCCQSRMLNWGPALQTWCQAFGRNLGFAQQMCSTRGPSWQSSSSLASTGIQAPEHSLVSLAVHGDLALACMQHTMPATVPVHRAACRSVIPDHAHLILSWPAFEACRV